MADNQDSETSGSANLPRNQHRENKSSEQRDSGNTDKKRPGRLPVIILAILVTILVIGATVYFFLTRNEVSTDDAYTEGRAITKPHATARQRR